jgi:subtilisin family serine protease
MTRHLVIIVLFTAASGSLAGPPNVPAPWTTKVDPRILDSIEASPDGSADFLVLLQDQADIRGAGKLRDKTNKGHFVYTKLLEAVARSQKPMIAELEKLGVEYQAFWIINMIRVRGNRHTLQKLAERTDVARIAGNFSTRVTLPAPVETNGPLAITGVEASIGKIRATNVWALGFTGQGVTVAGQDTGYQWNHPALFGKYRGYDGSTTNHNYNWHDAIHTNDVHNSGTNPCGYSLLVPCDDHSHGTHTMGTMVGDDGGSNQIGVAPGARWIGCRNMERGWGTPATYAECFQWFLAPTDLAGNNPDPSLAPDVINNSWACPASEGCTDVNVHKSIIETLQTAGIVVVVSAGNSGSGCSSVNDPPAIYDASFSVGATDINDNIASFSSRGPVTVDGSNRLKPNVSAPGVSIRSSAPGNTYITTSGTSMAGPHVAGVVALILSAHPTLRGQVDKIERLIEQTCVPRTSGQTCGGVSGSEIPNNTYGYGRVDALAALALDDTDGDGMPDWWEITEQFDKNNSSDAALDADGDGATNLQEYMAGTDPHDPEQVLRVTSVLPQGDGLAISFSTVSGKAYRVESAPVLNTNDWNVITNNVTGTGFEVQIAAPGALTGTQLFYRVRLLP